MEENKTEKTHYLGHRNRLRTRYIENGIDALAEHEILELFLFHSVPRVDTKPLAHRLIDEYGSLKNVFNASFESLKKHGLSDISAALIRLNSDIYTHIENDSKMGTNLADYNEAGRFAVSEFDGFATEKLVMLMLDCRNNVLGIKTVCEGSFAQTKVNMRNIVETCLDKKAAKVILAHNHPSGDIRPSADDYVTTTDVEKFLEGVGIELVEHFVVADGTFFGIKKHCNN